MFSIDAVQLEPQLRPLSTLHYVPMPFKAWLRNVLFDGARDDGGFGVCSEVLLFGWLPRAAKDGALGLGSSTAGLDV